MDLLITTAFSPIILPLTVLLILVLLYWVTVIIGIIEIDTLDVTFDSDLEVDPDVDNDFDAEGVSVSVAFLKFFYLGEMPLMVLVSLFTIFSWFVAILSNHYANPGLGLALGAILFLPNIVVSAFAVKVFGKPIAMFFQSLNKDLSSKRKMLGMPCVVTTSKVNSIFGQAQIETETSPILFNAITRDDEILQKGDTGVVLDFLEEKNTYIITSFD